MYEKIKDSRLRYTKQCLFDAFIECLAERPVSEITVLEVSEKAGVSRKTFYKHFGDQFGLLRGMQDDLFIGFQELLSELPASIGEIVPVLIRFSDENRVLVKAIFQNQGDGNFIDRVIDHLHEAYFADWLKENPRMPREDVEYLFYFVSSGIVGILRHWIIKEPQAGIEDVTRRVGWLMRLATPAD
jgi:AcrR family transcriptional regulator